MIVSYLVLAALAVSEFTYITCIVDNDHEKVTDLGMGKHKKDEWKADLIKDMQTHTGGINVNLHDLLEMTNKKVAVVDDIEEDQDDRFITKRDGSLRTKIFSTNQDNHWGEDSNGVGVRSLTGSLIRKKRCDDGDDGDTGRTRRTKKIKKVIKKVKNNQNTNSGTTVKTVKVIQNGQVISQSVQYAGQPTAVHHQVPLMQPVVHTQHHYGIPHQQMVANTQPQVVHTSPGVVVQQPAMLHVQQPVVYV